MSKITRVVSALAQPVAASLGLELWDVEYVTEAGRRFLRLYIDSPSGTVSINDCEAMSRAMDPVLDEADPIAESYTFEVSSAGADRELKRPSDFERYMGAKVEVRLYKNRDGVKSYTGALVSYEDGGVTIEQSGETLTFTKAEVAQVRLAIEF